MNKIPITENTINILRNFVKINQSIIIKPGNNISTMSVNKNILARAKVQESFPVEMPIYDLGVFLSGLSLFKEPVLVFDDSSKVTITEEGTKSKSTFFYSDPGIITAPPDANIADLEENVSFTLTQQHCEKLLRASNSYSVPDLCIYSQDGTIYVCVTDNKNNTSNSFAVEVGKSDKSFCYCFKVENLRILIGTYDVSIRADKVAHFDSKNTDLSYWIALEPPGN